MELEDLQDYLEPEYAVAAALLAAAFSPSARALVRRGVVYGLSGVLAVGDAVADLTRSVQRSVLPPAPSVSFVQCIADEARAERRMRQGETTSDATEPPSHTHAAPPPP